MKKVLWKLVLSLMPTLFAAAAMWWRIEQPVESYAVLIELSNYGSGFVLSSMDLSVQLECFGWDNPKRGEFDSGRSVQRRDDRHHHFQYLRPTVVGLTLPLRALGSLLKRRKKKSVKPAKA